LRSDWRCGTQTVLSTTRIGALRVHYPKWTMPR
jgi:hypothetical protein